MPARWARADFHSATLVGAQIWVVGSLGYADRRRHGVTQVCRLELATMAMTRLETTGEAPGWLHKHEAMLEDGAIVIRGGLVEDDHKRTLRENIDTWALDLGTLVWARRTRLDWQRWTMRRGDDKRTLLWNLRDLLDTREYAQRWIDEQRAEDEYLARTQERIARIEADLVQDCGRVPDLELLRTLYLCDGAAAVPKLPDDDYNVFRIELDGVMVRFTERSFEIAAIVEGRLADDRLEALQRHIVERLDLLESTDAWYSEA